MVNITVSNTETGVANCWLTVAGELALATPCGMKEYISNNRRDADGRNYLSASAHLDDTNISVQFVCLPTAESSAASIVESIVGQAKGGTLCGVSCLYKNVGSISQSGGAVYFNVNVIKLASSKSE